MSHAVYANKPVPLMLISQNQNWLIYCHNCRGLQVQSRWNGKFHSWKISWTLLIARCSLGAFAPFCSRIQISVPIFNLISISVRPPSEVGECIKKAVMFYWLNLVFQMMFRSDILIRTWKPNWVHSVEIFISASICSFVAE